MQRISAYRNSNCEGNLALGALVKSTLCNHPNQYTMRRWTIEYSRQSSHLVERVRTLPGSTKISSLALGINAVDLIIQVQLVYRFYEMILIKHTSMPLITLACASGWRARMMCKMGEKRMVGSCWALTDSDFDFLWVAENLVLAWFGNLDTCQKMTLVNTLLLSRKATHEIDYRHRTSS